MLDLFSRKVVGWAMDTQMTAELPLRALRMALHSRQPQPGLLHHSDGGSQYASYIYQAVLQSRAIRPSMSRTANCYDNAVMESFFASLKAELVDHRHFVAVTQARAEIFHYIAAFYNRQRLHSTLGYRSPDQFEADAPGLNSLSTIIGEDQLIEYWLRAHNLLQSEVSNPPRSSDAVLLSSR